MNKDYIQGVILLADITNDIQPCKFSTQWPQDHGGNWLMYTQLECHCCWAFKTVPALSCGKWS